MRDLLGRVTASVMGAAANAEVPTGRALAAAGVPPDAKVGVVRCNVYEEGFFNISETEGFEVCPPHTNSDVWRCMLQAICS